MSKRKKSAQLDETTLLRILRQEEQDSASYYDSEIATVQAEAMDRYHAKPYGDEIEGRSKVVTHDIEDTVNWIMPALLRAFAPSDELVTIDDDGLEDGDQTLKDAAAYLKHVWFKDNAGEIVIHDFMFDALVQKFGVIRAYWEDPMQKPSKTVEGVTAEQLQKYIQDGEYEIEEADVETKEADGQPYECFTLKLAHKPKVGRVCIEAVPVEEFRVSRRSRSLETCDYHAWRRSAYLAELMKEFPEKTKHLESGHSTRATDDSLEITSDARVIARFPDEPTVTTHGSSVGDEIGRRKVWQMIEYLRIDYDGDGVVELRRINRIGDTILENDAVDESEFTMASPIRVAHRLIGRSIADTLMDLQKIRTVLSRRALDSLSGSTMPRTIVSESHVAADGSTIDSLLDHDIGGVVKVKGNVGDAITTIATPDTSASALAMIEYMDRRSEEASGVNRHAMGIQPQAITETKGGIEMLQSAANQRVEQVARWLSLGLQEAMGKVLRLLVAHQDGPRMVKIAGKRIQMDPRRWSDESTVTVHVGSAGESRDRKIAGLNVIAGKQEAIMMKAGMDNPVCGIAEYRNTLAMIVEAMGHKSAGKFFKEIPPHYQPPPPQPDPKTQEMQQKGQLSQAELQMKGQMAQAELQQKAQLQQAEFQHKQQTAQMQAGIDRETTAMKLQNEQEMAMARLQSEQQLAVMRMNAEMELARWKAEQEFSIRAQESMAPKNGAAGSGSTETTIPADRPGGRLDA